MEQHARHAPLVKRHPCYNLEAHSVFGRIHLPVSPACNIGCRFCLREFNGTTQRPGVSRGLLPPKEAVRTVKRALVLCPQITVVGVAGPGESLATPHAVVALTLVHRRFPDLIGCLSTNGLQLFGYVKPLIDAGVKTVSVTVNAVDPDVLERINTGVRLNGRWIAGREGAELLIRRQLAGIRAAAQHGLMVKTNAVLIPGINEDHVEEIARTVSAAGATMMNVIPLIPNHELAHIPAPDCNLLGKARTAAERHLPVFRHCRQCRADACGIPGGQDLAADLYDQPQETFSHG
ncbi:MAG: FeMo cofactor biosynthesis protein NifB [Syntrophaceae bacterium PtaU1.Bin231]|nr:MAG: FeMo cofactor biosynthesis protein NifB [Syntrophaceae bacterium PtaU1.Bin231]